MKTVTIEGAYPVTLATNLTSTSRVTSPAAKLLANAEMGAPVQAKASTSLYESWIDVPEGMSSMVVGVGNWQNGPVDDMYLRLYDPNFTPISQPTSLNAPNQLVIAPTGNVGIADAIMSAIVVNPLPGRWNVQWPSVSGSMPDFELTAGAVPGANAAQIMADEVSAILQSGQNLAMRAADWSWACAGCKVAAYGIALIIASVAAGAMAATLTVESGLVVATAGWAGVTAPVALAFIVAICTGATLTVDFIVTSLCEWVGICS